MYHIMKIMSIHINIAIAYIIKQLSFEVQKFPLLSIIMNISPLKRLRSAHI